MSAPWVSLEAFDHVFAATSDFVECLANEPSDQNFGLIENYLGGNVRLALRHMLGDVCDYGFSISIDRPLEWLHDGALTLHGSGNSSPHTKAPPSRVCFDKPLVLANDVQVMKGAQKRIAPRSLIRLDRFNYRPVISGEPPFVFWRVQSDLGVEKVGPGLKEREVSVDVRFYAHSACASCRRKIEAAPERIDDCSCLGKNEPVQRLAFANQEAIARTINIELFDSGVRASFAASFDASVQHWQLGYGPVYRGYGIKEIIAHEQGSRREVEPTRNRKARGRRTESLPYVQARSAQANRRDCASQAAQEREACEMSHVTPTQTVEDRSTQDRSIPLESHRERDCQTEDVESALGRIGLLPKREDPVLFRCVGQNAYMLSLHLDRGLTLRTLSRLAACSDRAALIERALSQDVT